MLTCVFGKSVSLPKVRSKDAMGGDAGTADQENVVITEATQRTRDVDDSNTSDSILWYSEATREQYHCTIE